MSGQPELKATAVRVAPLAVCWRGFLLRRTEFAPSGDFHEQSSAVGRQKVWRRRIEAECTAQRGQTSKGEAAQLEGICHKQLVLGSSAHSVELEQGFVELRLDTLRCQELVEVVKLCGRDEERGVLQAQAV